MSDHINYAHEPAFWRGLTGPLDVFTHCWKGRNMCLCHNHPAIIVLCSILRAFDATVRCRLETWLTNRQGRPTHVYLVYCRSDRWFYFLQSGPVGRQCQIWCEWSNLALIALITSGNTFLFQIVCSKLQSTHISPVAFVCIFGDVVWSL